MNKFLLGAAVAATVGLSSTAFATMTAAWVNVSNENGGVGLPAGFESWDLRITTTGNSDWRSARIFTNGTFYQDPLGGNSGPGNSAFFPLVPSLRFDTYVSSPAGAGSTIVLGGFNGTNELPPGQIVFNESQLGIVWGDLVNSPPGEYTLARVTFSGPSPSFIGRISYGPIGDGSQTFHLPIPVIPEPTSLALLSLGGLVLMRPRKV